jgi:hypothetical protein
MMGPHAPPALPPLLHHLLIRSPRKPTTRRAERARLREERRRNPQPRSQSSSTSPPARAPSPPRSILLHPGEVRFLLCSRDDSQIGGLWTRPIRNAAGWPARFEVERGSFDGWLVGSGSGTGELCARFCESIVLLQGLARGRSETLVTSSSLSLCMDDSCLWQRCRIKEPQHGAVGLRLRVSDLEPRL